MQTPRFFIFKTLSNSIEPTTHRSRTKYLIILNCILPSTVAVVMDLLFFLNPHSSPSNGHRRNYRIESSSSSSSSSFIPLRLINWPQIPCVIGGKYRVKKLIRLISPHEPMGGWWLVSRIMVADFLVFYSFIFFFVLFCVTDCGWVFLPGLPRSVSIQLLTPCNSLVPTTCQQTGGSVGTAVRPQLRAMQSACFSVAFSLIRLLMVWFIDGN